jgi:hypothetical protein
MVARSLNSKAPKLAEVASCANALDFKMNTRGSYYSL